MQRNSNRQSTSILQLFLWIIIQLTTENTEVLVTSEDIRFAFNRCKNDSLSNSNWDEEWIWLPWKIPQNQTTHCLIKCFLTKLGLIDLKNRGLDKEKFLNQIKSDADDKLEELLKGPLDGTCLAYHIKWIELMENYNQIIRKAFYGYTEFDRSNNLIAKDLGETSIEFCNKNIIFSEYDVLKLIWKISLGSYKCYLKCIFQHFHYFDAYGRVDVNEVLRSAQEAEFMNSFNVEKINFCVHTANQLFLQGLCEVASELNRCLLQKVNGAKDIIQHRNEISRFY